MAESVSSGVWAQIPAQPGCGAEDGLLSGLQLFPVCKMRVTLAPNIRVLGRLGDQRVMVVMMMMVLAPRPLLGITKQLHLWLQGSNVSGSRMICFPECVLTLN